MGDAAALRHERRRAQEEEEEGDAGGAGEESGEEEDSCSPNFDECFWEGAWKSGMRSLKSQGASALVLKCNYYMID